MMKYPIEKETLRRRIRSVLPEIKELRHELHQIPEVGLKEFKTAERIREYVRSTRVEMLPPLLETDTVCLLQGPKPGRNVTLRADIDALAVEDKSGAAWASRHPGFSHACGHDGHSAILCGVLKTLADLRDHIKGSIRFVFQPAEEKLGGGKRLVEMGLLDTDPKPDAVFAIHGWPGIPPGSLSARAGQVMAAADRFVLTVTGHGGHGARPHATVDPIVTSARLVCALQSVVSRNIDPIEPAVVSVCTIHGGDADNVIPDSVTMEGTTRYLDPELEPLIKARMEQVISGICRSSGASYEFQYDPGYVPLVNNREMTQFARSVIQAYLGEEVWIGDLAQTMGAEDFAYYLEKVPGVFVRLGLGENHADLHTSAFDFNDDALENGMTALAAIAMEALFREA
jgi:hippurate hydrolase